jgi:hypothetical protein
MNTDITLFGKTNWRNKANVFGILQADRLLHMYIIGKTGTGKSTMLKTMFLQDIAAGRGACLLDPHGDLVQDVLACIPEERRADIIHFDMPNPDLNLRYNPFKRVSYEKRSLVASGIMDVFKKLWADAWGVRLEHILRNCILALLDQQEASLADIPSILLDKNFRAEAIKNIENEAVKEFWEKEFVVYKYYDFLPVLNKVGGMLAHPVIKRVLFSNKNEVYLRRAMDQQKIILVNLSKGHLGEDASHMLGALFVSSISAAAFSRADIEEETRVPYMLFADEFHNVTTLSLVTMLSELRKFKVGMILAHQYFHQLEEDVRHAVLGNVGTIIAFRVGADDAYYLTKEMQGIFADSFISHANYHMYVKLMIKGVPSKAFSAESLPYSIIRDYAGRRPSPYA